MLRDKYIYEIVSSNYRFMKLKFFLFLITLLVSSESVLAQKADSSLSSILIGKAFFAKEIIGIKDFSYNPEVETIILTPIKENTPFGNVTSFKDGIFISGNYGECGNECRVTVTGKYGLEGNTIYLFVESIRYWKECSDKPMLSIQKDIGTFSWQIHEGVITLNKVN